MGADIAGDTREEADLAFRVGGQLAVLDVMAGQQVKKGELLARLDATDYRLQVELREANHRLAKSQFQRLKVMLPQGGATQSQFDEAKATLDQAANALQQAKNQLAYTHLYAPYDGVISSVSTENYQYVNATQPLMHLQNNQVLDVEFQVPENLIARLYRVNYQYQPKVLIDVIPGRVYNSHYREHTTTPDSYTKAYDVSLTLERPEQDDVVLLPGMTATVEIDLRELLQHNRQALLVPVEAVFLDCGDTLIDESTEEKIDGTEIVTRAEEIPHAMAAVRSLHAAGYRLALVADGPRETFENLLKPREIWPLMDAHVISGDVGELKPSPKMFATAMEKLGLPDTARRNVVMVGNNLERDIKGANDFGLVSLFVGWSKRRTHQPADVSEEPSYRIDSLDALVSTIETIELGLPEVRHG
ncbi:MAG: efflux RND transporter periplasmic adaptor subunit [Exilibacterium sp.]